MSSPGWNRCSTKSLLNLEEGPEGAQRFSMLETLQAYARERLERQGGAEALQRAHAAYFTGLAAEADPELRGGASRLIGSRRLRAERTT